MNKNKMSLYSDSCKIVDFEKLNENFTKAKCYVLALGKNQNKSFFAKDVVDAAYDSLRFVPVIGHLMETEDGKHYLGGHDYIFDKDKLSFKSMCVPFGVAIPSQEPTYETVVEADGTMNQYLVTDIVLWTGRYPELKEAVYNDTVMFGESMEVYFGDSKPLEEDKTYTEILSFTFDALCMLNKSDDKKFNVEPCFPSASIVKADYSLDKDAFGAFFEELKTQLKSYFTTQEGGVDLGAESNEPKNYVAEFAATYGKKRDAIQKILQSMRKSSVDEDGNVISETYYYLMDFDDEYAFVSKESYVYDGHYDSSYSNWRISYQYDETKNEAVFNGEPEEVFKEWLTAEQRQQLDAKTIQFQEAIDTMVEEHKETVAEFDAYVGSHSVDNATWESANEELGSLRQFKADCDTKARVDAVNAVFAKYEDCIGEMDEFVELKGNYGERSIEEIDSTCVYLVGKFALEHPTKEKSAAVRFAKTPVDTNIDDNVAYGGLVEKYAPKK